MKPSRHAKQLEQLESLESELRGRLTAVLPRLAVRRRTLIFTNREFNPHALLAAHMDREAEVLLDLSRHVEQLRRELVLPLGEGPAHLYLAACEESADLSNPHRLGPRRLAERVLSALGEE